VIDDGPAGASLGPVGDGSKSATSARVRAVVATYLALANVIAHSRKTGDAPLPIVDVDAVRERLVWVRDEIVHLDEKVDMRDRLMAGERRPGVNGRWEWTLRSTYGRAEVGGPVEVTSEECREIVDALERGADPWPPKRFEVPEAKG
jgi:hypothetical protein